MIINNIWGIFFSMVLPLVILIALAYNEVVEEDKRMKNKIKRRIK